MTSFLNKTNCVELLYAEEYKSTVYLIQIEVFHFPLKSYPETLF